MPHTRSYHCPVCNWFLARVENVADGTQPFTVRCRCPKCKTDRDITVHAKPYAAPTQANDYDRKDAL